MPDIEKTQMTTNVLPVGQNPAGTKVESLSEPNPKSGREILNPPTVTRELNELYKIEVALPGVTREELNVFVEDKTIKIFVEHKEYNRFESGIHHLENFQRRSYEVHLPVPDLVDNEYCYGELKPDLLCLYLPKMNYPGTWKSSRIFVY